MITSLILDLGTTHIKVGVWKDSYAESISLQKAPTLSIQDCIVECSAKEYFDAVSNIFFQEISQLSGNVQVGIASQRSSFLLWNKWTGEPVTPLISWQDRRAYQWCESHQKLNALVHTTTGLVLSPHYVGPKLAILLQDVSLKRGVENHAILFGTLETYCIWKWTKGRIHQTDMTMAARTMLFDIDQQKWSDEIINILNISHNILPVVVSTNNQNIMLDNNVSIKVTIADQAAAALNVFRYGYKRVLINLGTGGFLLSPITDQSFFPQGYLKGPFLGQGAQSLYALEATINGIGAVWDDFQKKNVQLALNDMNMDLFCIPDGSGVGAPFWRPDLSLVFSKQAATIKQKYQAFLEGIIFRIRAILEDWKVDHTYEILLSGGLIQDAFIGQGLAACLDRSIQVLEQKEATLSGVLSLLDAHIKTDLKSLAIVPSLEGEYLKDKYFLWKNWIKTRLFQHQA